MLKSAQKATRGEGGFTLIELLVVMIIIAILMAVAVPTFLKQKQTALATKAKANVKHVVTTVESCAASNTTGSYTAPRNCTDYRILLVDEPALQQVALNATATPAANTCSVSGGTATAYTVTCSYTSEVGTSWVREAHLSSGAINKTCGPTSKSCPTGLPANKMW